jgi:hypothetical protein
MWIGSVVVAHLREAHLFEAMVAALLLAESSTDITVVVVSHKIIGRGKGESVLKSSWCIMAQPLTIIISNIIY